MGGFVGIPVPHIPGTGTGTQSRDRQRGTVPGLTGILVPRCRDLLSRKILVAGLSHRFFSRSRLSRGFGSRSRSWGFAGQDRDPGIAPGQPPIRARDSRDWDKNLRDRQESRSVTVRSSCPGILCDANRIQSRCLWIQFDAFKSSLVPRSSRDDFLSSFL